MDSGGIRRNSETYVEEMCIARTANTKPGVQYRDSRTIYTQVRATTDLSMRYVHVHAGRLAPGGKSIKPMKGTVQDASFSAWVIRCYFQGATSSNSVITGKDHVVRSVALPMTRQAVQVGSAGTR